MHHLSKTLIAPPILFSQKFLALLVTVILYFGAIPTAEANSKYAGVVIDAKTGKTLYSENADVPRYPASLTKMMTLYLTFDALKSGRITKGTKVTVSRKAAREVPSKLGLRAGQTITVEQIVLALVTKSANDAATAMGEFIGGSEAGFARMMTNKARQLGMKSTTFKNAHGLPNKAQKTTARDMARLGMALRDHHPGYYDYFTTRSFKYKGRKFGNHNRLLGRVKGVDGIKTGYTNASGFNLVSSVEARDRSVVAVVMGGRTGRSRDAHMTSLISRYLSKASTGPDRFRIERGGASALVASLVPTSSIPIPTDNPGPGDGRSPERSPEPSVEPELVAIIETTNSATRVAGMATPDEIDFISTASMRQGEWVIQIGSMPDLEAARKMLKQAARKAPQLLADAFGFTESFTKDGQVYFRARYGGFDAKSDARSACGVLKQKDMDCYALLQQAATADEG